MTQFNLFFPSLIHFHLGSYANFDSASSNNLKVTVEKLREKNGAEVNWVTTRSTLIQWINIIIYIFALVLSYVGTRSHHRTYVRYSYFLLLLRHFHFSIGSWHILLDSLHLLQLSEFISLFILFHASAYPKDSPNPASPEWCDDA